jgi:hypothetical protein
MAAFAHRSLAPMRGFGKPFAKSIDQDILRKAFDAFAKASAEADRASDILRAMSISTIPIVKAIMRDDVSAFSIWCLANPNFVVELEGRKESALTLACAANARDCVNSMLLRGLVPGWRANQAAVQTGDTALMRKVDNATPDEISRFRPFLCAVLMELVDVSRSSGENSPRSQSGMLW